MSNYSTYSKLFLEGYTLREIIKELSLGSGVSSLGHKIRRELGDELYEKCKVEHLKKGLSKRVYTKIIRVERELSCKFCKKPYKYLNGLSNHECRCKLNPERIKNGYELYVIKNGIWNKGLTKEVDDRVQKYAEGISIALKGRTGFIPSKETRKKLSIARSANNKGGRCKWYSVGGIKVQGTWERDIALKMISHNIWWEKLTHGSGWDIFFNNKNRTYTPDFYIKELNVFLEVKGYWWGDDRAKTMAAIEQHPGKSLVVIEEKSFNSLLESKSKTEFLDTILNLHIRI